MRKAKEFDSTSALTIKTGHQSPRPCVPVTKAELLVSTDIFIKLFPILTEMRKDLHMQTITGTVAMKFRAIIIRDIRPAFIL